MRIIKLAFISLVFFGGLLFLMSLLVPSKVRISKAINLAPDDSTTLQLIRDTGSWQRWHPAYQNGNRPGGRIVPANDSDTLVAMDIVHQSGNSVRNSWELHRFGAGDSLTLQWYMDFRLSWKPWHRFSSLFYEGTYGRMMEMGLNNLRDQRQEP